MSQPAQVTPPPGKMTREAYLTWVEQQPRGRFERIDGEVISMASERVGHALVKVGAYIVLARAIAKAGVRCEALPDGVTVRVGEHTDYEPDALINCGDPVDRSSIFAPNPVVVLEVESSSTAGRDSSNKLIDYCKLPSIQHYLIFNVHRKSVVHHRRTADAIATTILRGGALTLDPPGIVVDVAAFFPSCTEVPATGSGADGRHRGDGGAGGLDDP